MATSAKGIANTLNKPRLLYLTGLVLGGLLLVGGAWAGYRWWTAGSGLVLPGGSGTAAPIAIALDGHCPVTLSTEMRWSPGHVAWNAVYGGELYLFASPRHQEVFLINPASYGPALAGTDAVELAEHGRPTRGNRQYGVNHGGKIFLFASEQNLTRFAQSPDQFLKALEALEAGQPAAQAAEQVATRVDLSPTLR